MKNTMNYGPKYRMILKIDDSIYRYLQILNGTQKPIKMEGSSLEGMALFWVIKSWGMMGYIAESFSTWRNKKQIWALKRRHANFQFFQEAEDRNGVGKKYTWRLAWQPLIETAGEKQLSAKSPQWEPAVYKVEVWITQLYSIFWNGATEQKYAPKQMELLIWLEPGLK